MKIGPQPMPQPGDTDVSPLVIADITSRNQVGFAKYGTRLQTFNGRNALQDAYEEVLDCAQYLRSALEENLPGRLKNIKELIDTWSKTRPFTTEISDPLAAAYLLIERIERHVRDVK